MNKTKYIIILITILVSFKSKKNDFDNQYTETILMDLEYLASTRARIEKDDPELKDAYDQLIEDAEAALKEGPLFCDV